MIHVLSVHYRSARWFDLQLCCLEEFVPEPFELYWSVEAVPEREIPRRRSSTTVIAQRGAHAEKLNALADHVVAAAGATTCSSSSTATRSRWPASVPCSRSRGAGGLSRYGATRTTAILSLIPASVL